MDTSILSSKEQDQLLELGVLTMSVLGINHVPMRNVVNYTIEQQLANTTFIDTVGKTMKAHGSEVDPMVALYLLQSFIQASPPEGQWHALQQQFINGWSLQAVMIIFVVTRLLVKKFVVGQVRRDDWAMLLAMLMAIALSISETVDAKAHKACEHIWNLSYDHIRENLKSLFIVEIFYVITSWTVKSAIMLFFWDLVPRDSSFRFFHRSIFWTFIAVSLILFYSIFVVVFQCKPVNWWEDPVTAKCLPRQIIFTTCSALIVLSDFVVLILPIKVVWSLKLRTREKVIITMLFCLGTMACAACLYRLILFAQLVERTDITYNQCSVSTWSVAENSLAVLAACVPAMKALVTRYTPALRFRRTIPKLIDTFTFTKTSETLRSEPPVSPSNAIEITRLTEVQQTVARTDPPEIEVEDRYMPPEFGRPIARFASLEAASTRNPLDLERGRF